jgi:hypothetical protein
VTSRARLQVDRERVVELRPLVVPRGDELDGPAARCFLACARRARADFAPSPAGRPSSPRSCASWTACRSRSSSQRRASR